MRKIALAAAAASILFAGSVSAADMAPRYTKAPPAMAPVMTWTGWYVGVNAGAAINDTSYSLEPSRCFVSTVAPCGGGPAVNPLRTYSARPDNTNATAGGQLGYNYQFSPIWVAGFEADINWSGVRNSDPVTQVLAAPLAGSFIHTVTTSLDWFGTVRGRVGFLASPNLLLYGTGGLAYGRIGSSTAATFTLGGDTYVGSTSTTRVGWTAGAGAEWMAWSNWSVKAEYLFLDLGRTSYTDTCGLALCTVFVPPPAYTTNVTTREHVVRVGINYHFNGPVVAKY